MSLLPSRKFWTTWLRLSTLCCYLSGFGYYLQTALATLVTPLVAITLLGFLPEQISSTTTSGSLPAPPSCW
jgi:cellulose synthase (UDP-forming)